MAPRSFPRKSSSAATVIEMLWEWQYSANVGEPSWVLLYTVSTEKLVVLRSSMSKPASPIYFLS